MEEKQIETQGERLLELSDAVIIEIVHGIKDILIELIDRAFPKNQI